MSTGNQGSIHILVYMKIGRWTDRSPWWCCVGLWGPPCPSHAHAAASDSWAGSDSGSSGDMGTLFEQSALTPRLWDCREVRAGDKREAEGKLGDGMAHCFIKGLQGGVSCPNSTKCLFWNKTQQKAHINVSSFTDQFKYFLVGVWRDTLSHKMRHETGFTRTRRDF